MNFFHRVRIGIVRLVNYEYWPYPVFYFPMFFYGLYLGAKAKSIMYFVSTNPAMKYGGALGESKKKILELIDKKHQPKSVLIKRRSTINSILSTLSGAGISYPVIAKPDIGERGFSVEKIENEAQLNNYFGNNGEDIILQEFVDYPIEAGVLYYRFPGKEEGHISSVVMKKFLEITGDGKHTIEELMAKETRAAGRLDYLRNKFRSELDVVLKKGETKLLEPIGNHCRGATFYNGNPLINRQLIRAFDKIGNIKGFYYGRFDLRAKSLEDLQAGKDLMILELNGVSSEPAHIYDPGYKLWMAYRDVISHMNIIYKIAKANGGAQSNPGFLRFIKDLNIHFRRKKSGSHSGVPGYNLK